MCGRKAWMRESVGKRNAVIASCACTIGGMTIAVFEMIVVLTCVCTGLVANRKPTWSDRSFRGRWPDSASERDACAFRHQLAVAVTPDDGVEAGE